MDWLRFWDFTSADWAGLQFLILAIAAAVGLWQVWEARRLRYAQAQPFVVVDLEAHEASQVVYLVISNIGTTMARDVVMRFDPPLTSSMDETPGGTPPAELKPLRDGIPSLPPGKRIRIMFDTFLKRDENTYPDVYKVDVSFHAPALGRDFQDRSVLDLGVYRNVQYLIRRDVHDVHERLKELVREVKRIRVTLSADS